MSAFADETPTKGATIHRNRVSKAEADVLAEIAQLIRCAEGDRSSKLERLRPEATRARWPIRAIGWVLKLLRTR